MNTCLEARLHLRTATEGRQGQGASRAQLVKRTQLLLIALKQYKPESLFVGITERCALRACAGHLHAPREAARVCRKVAVQAGIFYNFFLTPPVDHVVKLSILPLVEHGLPTHTFKRKKKKKEKKEKRSPWNADGSVRVCVPPKCVGTSNTTAQRKGGRLCVKDKT